MKASNVAMITVASLLLCLFVVAVSGNNESSAAIRRRDTTDERNLQATVGVVNKLVLINAGTNTVITELVNGQIIKFASLQGNSAPALNIQAFVTGTMSSVRFGFNNNPRYSNENVAPYAFCGDSKIAFKTCPDLTYGTHTVTATPILNGVKGTPVRIMFTLLGNSVPVKPPTAPPVPTPVSNSDGNFIGLRLMYTHTYPTVFVKNLQFDALNVINLRSLNLPFDDFNIEVLVNSNIKSVLFSNGRFETSPPLAYCGNFGDNYHTCSDIKLGNPMKISVTGYSGPYGAGTIVATRETTIHIVRSAKNTVPVPSPVRLPVPVSPPIAPVQGCPLPKMVGEWKKPYKPYPISVAEAQGTMIGNDFIITSGFKNGYTRATPETYALNMIDSAAEWRRMDDMPFRLGLTHLGAAVKGMKAYFCGGYVGGSLGIHNASCFEYDHSVAPGNGQWKNFPSLPDGGRSGGGLIYDSTVDALVYSAGSKRPIKGSKSAIDFRTTWIFYLNNPSAGWVRKADIPFSGNHMNFVTAHDETGKERHFFFGGQAGDNEEAGNTDDMYEYDVTGDKWILKQSIPNPLGHAAASARAIGCGFIVAGGRLNDGLTDAILYYDIPTNKWTHIGELTHQIHTNVCVIGGGMLRCETGWANGSFSWTRGITV